MKTRLGRYVSGRWWMSPLRLPRDLYREARDFVKRGLYGIAPSDTWSLDFYLEGVIEEGLRILRRDTHGYPADTTNDEWQKFLDTTANTIAHYRFISDEMPYSGMKQWDEEKKAYDEMVVALHRLVDRWGSLWD